MKLRSVWSYLLCVIKDGHSAKGQQIVLAWYSFAGRSYRRDGAPCTGAGNIADSLARGELQSEALAWSLGFDPQEAFSVGFQARFRATPSSTGALDICDILPSKNSASLKIYDDKLLASLRCDGVDIAITAKRQSVGKHSVISDSPETNVLPGLSAFRLRLLDFNARLKTDRCTEDVGGVAYFQQVRSRIPLVPWDWCYCVFPDGSLAGISTFRVGRDLFASDKNIRSDDISAFNMPIFSRGFFLDGRSGKLFRMARSKVVSSINIEGRGRIKSIVASDGSGFHMQFDVVVQDSHSLEFARDLRPFSNLNFCYRSSVGSVEKFIFEKRGSEIGRRSFETGSCNLERTYGLML